MSGRQAQSIPSCRESCLCFISHPWSSTALLILTEDAKNTLEMSNRAPSCTCSHSLQEQSTLTKPNTTKASHKTIISKHSGGYCASNSIRHFNFPPLTQFLGEEKKTCYSEYVNICRNQTQLSLEREVFIGTQESTATATLPSQHCTQELLFVFELLCMILSGAEKGRRLDWGNSDIYSARITKYYGRIYTLFSLNRIQYKCSNMYQAITVSTSAAFAECQNCSKAFKQLLL